MSHYFVQWEIDLDAESLEDAAIGAFNSMQSLNADTGTLMAVFNVTEKQTGKTEKVGVDAIMAARGRR